MIRQQLSQKQLQKLSPLQIQQAKLLELTGLEIEKRINQELEDNPALEEEDKPVHDEEAPDADEDFEQQEQPEQEDLSLGDYRTEDDIPDYKLQQSYYSDQSAKEDIPYVEAESLQEYLLNQFYLRPNLSEEMRKTGEYVIGNVDSEGYIRRSAEDLSDDLAFQYGMEVPVAKIEEILHVIRNMDPPGVGAFDLRQCLIIQLERKEKTPERALAVRILKEQFDAFSRHLYEKVIRLLDISEEQMKDAVHEITQLNPRPGNGWESNIEAKSTHITPDFIVENVNGELQLVTNEKVPELRVSREYGEMLNGYSAQKDRTNREQRDAFSFVKQKIDSAKWFIDAIKQRNTTLRKTMLAIMSLQKDFFLSGEASDLKPMILKDVAERCGYDVTTVSRVSNSKYVQTNFGVYPLKYFFSGGMLNDEGEEVSTSEIKAFLKKCVDEEEKSNPLTDDLLMKKLKEHGYDVARRTVAKYREQMNIPVARLRKEI
ncbi:MAG: RNA polymerase factor sigma-54 [Dysgonamonadaceae bacterium]|jgi:RNA polymerase sigma-54 factor|nr:RNA polymerase factor sigma-54 [Dysgonamonadaceae bacterium]